tara:strand:- start:1293 stop:4430 length:3138 start_codon:yes stop_codon:yes gene_type:complete
MKIVHIADVHFRGLSRHEEYVRAFLDFFKKAKELEPDVIYVGGDIVHSKTQGISPELIDVLSWWFTNLADIAPTHVILGNHDGLILNKDRQDAITPIIKALNNPNIHLYKQSGTYPTGVPGFNWCVFSCFDEAGWEDVKPVDGDVNIALFHGGVLGSKTDINWNIEGEVKTSFFKDYEFALLGDIHKMQYLDDEKRIAYCGSTIQQNYGEDPGKGFLFWDITNRDTFSSTFHEVHHDQPFVTIDWKGNVPDTMIGARKHPDGSRFRVKSENQINQTDIVHLHSELKHVKEASEIVYKYDVDFGETALRTTDEGNVIKDLRSEKTLQGLMKEYYKGAVLKEDEWKTLEDLVSKHSQAAVFDNAVARNTKWSIKTMKFDNVFGYGKGNYINFETLPGITGIFGKNRSGKSSIIGTLMYGLYNTTDRGPIKNVHIINSRKGHCKVGIDLGINGKNYRVERQSVKHQNRSGQVNATTHLNFYRTGLDGEMIQDLTEEQRRETEKVLRKLLGTADDFLMTSLASQGQMNNFIKERATSRKMILTKFLDLEIFEKMLDSSKEESRELQSALKNVPDRDWDVAIYDVKKSLDKKRTQITKTQEAIDSDRSKLQDLKLSLSKFDDADVVTHHDVDLQKKLVKRIKEDIQETEEKISDMELEFASTDEKLKKIDSFKSMFSLEDLNKRIKEQRQVEASFVDLRSSLEKEKIRLSSQKKLAKKIEPCDCFEHLPTCRYVQDVDRSTKEIDKKKELIESLADQVDATEKALDLFKQEALEEKLSKYNKVLQQEVSLRSDKNDLVFKRKNHESTLKNKRTKLKSSEETLLDLESKVLDISVDEKLLELKTKIEELTSKINESDSLRISLAESVGKMESNLNSLKEEKEKFIDLKKKLKIYDLFNNAMSKKGIPLQIIMTQLPSINTEIAKILQGVVGFTVELEADKNSNQMDIYINYGDSKRVIELASGMEKMMASLAIRVALINVSSLPKTDVLIIDEGFGALDAMNVEACNRLLESLKRWFQHILVISHVDAVKDVVDNVIDITRKSKNSHVYVE